MNKLKPHQNRIKTIGILTILLLGSLVGCGPCNFNSEPKTQKENTKPSLITQEMIETAQDAGADYQFLVDKLTALKQSGKKVDINEVDPTSRLLNTTGKNLKDLTALHYAVFLNAPVIIRALCKLGANKEAKDAIMGRTPLIWAAFKEYLSCTLALLSQPGIDVNARDNANKTALSHATGDQAIIDALKAKGATR